MLRFLNFCQNLLDKFRVLDFLAPLALRAYLVPILWTSGTKKLSDIDSVVQWFGSSLGLPYPNFMAWAATLTEVGGAILLALGLAVRWVSIPLMITMAVAAWTVHMDNGWLAIAEGEGIFATERTMGAIERLDKAKEILKAHGDYGWLTENGSFVVLNNGIEFAATYFVMLFVLFFVGGGKYLSLDYWLAKRFQTAGLGTARRRSVHRRGLRSTCASTKAPASFSMLSDAQFGQGILRGKVSATRVGSCASLARHPLL